MDAED
jgi:hypothetical protein